MRRDAADDGPRPDDGRGPRRAGISRRELLAAAAAVGVGAGLDRVTTAADGRARADVVAFDGVHQAGIATPQQRELAFAAYDVAAPTRQALRELLQRWTAAARAVTTGREYAAGDPGETAGMPPARLTLTFGLGPSLFESASRDRFGLAHLRPPALEPLPPFPGELLDPASSGGDLCVQACADDPQVAFHAIHLLTRLGGADVVLRWLQRGFWPGSSGGRTARNLLGFKDGTANIPVDDEQAMNRHVWVQQRDGPAWLRGGTYLVARRIEVVLESWDSIAVEQQERAIGRHKLSGAPLGGRQEHDPLRLDARDPRGDLLIPLDAHVRVASTAANDDIRILRRGYSYSAGSRPGPLDRGGHQLDSGLFFIAFVRDPAAQFIQLQRRLATDDALNMFTTHTASAIFACPPGTGPTGYVGERLFA